MNPLVFAWIASVTYGLYSLTAKLIGKYQIQNNYQFSFFMTLFSSVIMVIVAVFNGGYSQINNWLHIILAAFLLAGGNVLYLRALKALDITVISPLFNIRVAITVLLGYFFLNEVINLESFLLITIIFLAGFFASMDEHFSLKSFFNKNIAVGLGFMVVLSVQSIFVNLATNSNGYWPATLWMSLLAILFSFLLTYRKFKDDYQRTPLRSYSSVATLAVIGGLGDLAAYKAFSGNVGLSSVIISLPISMVLAFAIAYWKPTLLEKHSARVYLIRFIAAAIMIYCALQLK